MIALRGSRPGFPIPRPPRDGETSQCNRQLLASSAKHTSCCRRYLFARDATSRRMCSSRTTAYTSQLRRILVQA